MCALDLQTKILKNVGEVIRNIFGTHMQYHAKKGFKLIFLYNLL